MKLSEAQHKQLLEHLQEKWKAPAACHVCKSNDWEVPVEIYEMREFHGGSMVLGGNSSIIPTCPITCKVCGNTVFINPLVAGIKLKEDSP